MTQRCFYMVFGLLLIASLSSRAQQADDILGKWQNPSGEGRIEIFKKENHYYGRLYWLKNPNNTESKPKRDEKNPDPKLRTRLLKDLIILTGFNYKGNGVWADGEIYDPKSGKTYSCKMTLKGNDRLDIRGYIGISLIGRSEEWSRIK